MNSVAPTTVSNSPGNNIAPPKFFSGVRTTSLSELTAQEFSALSQQVDHDYFALSLRDLDILVDSTIEKMPTMLVGQTKTVLPKHADLKIYLPVQYHDYLDVFDRGRANKLPPHRLWDHAIDLQPGKMPPASRPYSMNLHELKSLREYLEKELAKGFCYGSTTNNDPSRISTHLAYM